MRVRVIKTRPPFDHAKHIRLMGKTLLMWFPFYLMAYAWHRFGPTKSVSYLSTEGFHRATEPRPVHNIATYIPEIQTDAYGRPWYWDSAYGQWRPMAVTGGVS